MTVLWLIFALLIIFFSFIFNNVPEKLGYRNSAVLSGVALFIFVTMDILFLPDSWWNLGYMEFTLIMVLTLFLGVINIMLMNWFMSGADYILLNKKGMINMGCTHTQGKYQILKNFTSTGAMVLGEEIVFRGGIGLGLYFWLGPIPAILITSISFGLLHFLPIRHMAIKNGITPGLYVVGVFILTSIFPAIFIIVNLTFRTLVAGWLMHWGLNCMVGAYMRYFYKEKKEVQVVSQN